MAGPAGPAGTQRAGPREIRRFGIGHRRPEGPPGSTGVSSAIIESGPRATIAELAFVRGGTVKPHANRNATWMLIIEGGGFVRSGDAQTRIAAGEAILFEPGELHAVWTEYSEMRAIVVDLGTADPGVGAALLGSGAATAADAATDPAVKADGGLVVEKAPAYDPSEGEPA
jgi:quercetin dioxygenase-like cupin family protein